MTAPRHVDVGAYVLGILDPPDEAAYERHFAQCEECRREFIELADMPAILDTLKPDKAPAQPPPKLPPLSSLIDFEQLRTPPKPATSPPSMPSMPAVPPQQRPNGATQPHRLPRPDRSTSPDRSNDTTRPSPAAPSGQPERPRANGTTRPSPAAPSGQADRARTNDTRPSPAAPSGQPERPRANPAAGGPSSTSRSRAEGTGRHSPASSPRATGTGRHAPVSPGTGRSLPAASRGDSATRSTPGSRPTASPAARSKAVPARVKPPSKPRDSGPAGRASGLRGRKPVWLTAAAVVLAALTVGVMIGWPSGEPGNQVADKNTTAPSTPPSGAVAGAHVVSGTDPETGVTAIITIEPVPDGTEIDMVLYEIDGPQKGVLIAVSRFGEREEVAEWQVPEEGAARGESIRATGVAPFAQQDINRFEFHGDGIEPLLVVPT